MPLYQALESARSQGLDLVEVAATSVPPVCRILDYGKFRYAQERKERELRKGQKVVLLREIRLRPKIGDHDFDAKARATQKLLNGGDKVKVTIMFRGREISHPDIGAGLLQRMVEAVKGEAGIEKQPVMDGRRMIMVLAPLPQRAKAKETPVAKPKEAVAAGTKETVKEEVKNA
jgi:translation initiation factor IF-3